MAIKKEIELDSGLTANYIRIASIEKVDTIDRGKVCFAIVEIYGDRKKKPAYICSEEIKNVDSWSDAYIELKNIEKYEGATDA